MKNKRFLKVLSNNTASIRHFLAVNILSGNNPNPAASKSNEKYTVKTFRLLSAHVFDGNGYPVDYTTDKPLSALGVADMFNQKLYKDHSFKIDDAIGFVKECKYNSETTPPGVDGEIWIDKYIDDKTCHKVETGIIDRCSVTISFEWRPSHPQMNRNDFFDKLGQTVNNEQVRVIVTKVLQIYETSLVPFGADPTAQSYEQENYKTLTQQGKEDILNPKILQMLKQLYGKEFLTELEIEQGMQTLAAQIQGFQEKEVQYKTEIDRLKPFETFSANVKQSLKTEVTALLQLTKKVEKLDTLDSLALDNASYDQLVKMRQEYTQKKAEVLQGTCQHCGKPVSNIRSSVEPPINEATPVQPNTITFRDAGI